MIKAIRNKTEKERIFFQIQKTELKARLDERNKVIQDLSHHIKNLISSVIDPLERIHRSSSSTEHKSDIENALRGTKLIREIVNAMNLSFQGSIEDFQYDIEKNSNGKSLNHILIKSLQYAISNMFDAKNFHQFQFAYFKGERKLVREAKSDWQKVSGIEEFEHLINYTNRYFFYLEHLNIERAEQYLIGDDKNSTLKLLILFQEILLNAVKYTGFVEKEKRFIKIEFIETNELIQIRVANSYLPDNKIKSSGLGHVIIENFAKLLKHEPEIQKQDGIYSITIKFQNFWNHQNTQNGEENENTIR